MLHCINRFSNFHLFIDRKELSSTKASNGIILPCAGISFALMAWCKSGTRTPEPGTPLKF